MESIEFEKEEISILENKKRENVQAWMWGQNRDNRRKETTGIKRKDIGK